MGFDRDNLHISVVKRMGGPQELFADLITQKQDTGKPELQHTAGARQLAVRLHPDRASSVILLGGAAAVCTGYPLTTALLHG